MTVYVLECHEEERSRVIGVFSDLEGLEAHVAGQVEDGQVYSSLALTVDLLGQTRVQVFYHFLFGDEVDPDRPDKRAVGAAAPSHTWRRL